MYRIYAIVVFILLLAVPASDVSGQDYHATDSATQPRANEFVEALWNTPVPDGIERYYEGLLYMMALLHCSGEFRIWTPK